jgi:hypothetical protein
MYKIYPFPNILVAFAHTVAAVHPAVFAHRVFFTTYPGTADLIILLVS